jgi:hypothetical protein
MGWRRYTLPYQGWGYHCCACDRNLKRGEQIIRKRNASFKARHRDHENWTWATHYLCEDCAIAHGYALPDLDGRPAAYTAVQRQA